MHPPTNSDVCDVASRSISEPEVVESICVTRRWVSLGAARPFRFSGCALQLTSRMALRHQIGSLLWSTPLNAVVVPLCSSSGSKNRRTFPKACTATSCARAPFERRDCFTEWTAAHPRKSHTIRVLRSCQHTEKTAAFSFMNRSARSAALRAVRGARQGQFQGQSWGQRRSRNVKPRVYLGFSTR